jgi:hypothetical protein
MLDTQSFSNIDAAKWARIQASVKDKAGIDMVSNIGAGTAKGLTIGWVYHTDSQILAVTVVKRSFYDPSESTIDADIAQWIASA